MPYQSNRAVVGVSGHSRVKTAALISALAVLLAVVIFVAVKPEHFGRPPSRRFSIWMPENNMRQTENSA